MNNKKSIIKYEIFSIIFIAIIGSLLHFTYEWSNNNILIGGFSAVNESVWEHLKLIFFPTLIIIIIGSFYNKEILSRYLSAKTKGLLALLLFIIIFYYTYTGILGFNISLLDIGSFFIAIFIGEFITLKDIIFDHTNNSKSSIIILIILLCCFITFTYCPPKIGLFKDPITNTYGIYRRN